MAEPARLVGKRALVTGGSRGIGAAIARRLAAEGAAVAVNYVADASSADKCSQSRRCSSISATTMSSTSW